MSIWREIAAPIVKTTISTVGTGDMRVLRAALREAYPFTHRRNAPYKAWCREIRHQLGVSNARRCPKTPDMFKQEV